MSDTAEITPQEAIQTAERHVRIINERAAAIPRERAGAEARAAAAQERAATGLRAKILGQPGAEEAYLIAVRDRSDALAEVSSLDAESAEALGLRRIEETRISQLRVQFWPELTDEPEAATQAVRTAAEELREPLREYIGAWQRAAAAWSKLGASTVEHLRERDRELGQLRDPDLVRTEAHLPGCPISSGAVVAILNTAPRPRFLASGFRSEPEPFASVGDVGEVQ